MEYVVSLFATFRSESVVVPVNSAYKGRLLAHVLNDSEASIALCEAALVHRIAAAAELGLSGLRHVVVLDEGDICAGELERLRSLGVNVVTHADQLSVTSEYTAAPMSTEVALCLYTGGTTGPSKGCLLSHNALVHHAQIVTDAYKRTREDVLWTPLPLFHLNAIKFGVIGALLTGGRSAISAKFSVSRFWSDIEAADASIANVLGSMATLIARSDHEPTRQTLRLLVAVPMPEETRRILVRRFGFETFSGMYGMTECSTISLLPSTEGHRPDSAGQVNDRDYDVRIFSQDGDEVPDGTPGEIVVRPRRGNLMFAGYLNRPADTLAAFSEGWFRTGDIGRLDEDGYLWFVDRKGDYLRRRGENISTFEIEAILLEHKEIADVAVHAIPSELTEDDLKITAVRKDDTLTEAELFEWLVPRVPYFALPSAIEFRETLPRSDLGRVLKWRLRDEGMTAASWSTEDAMRLVDRN